MDKLEQYRHAIKKILTEYYEISNPQNVENGKMEASERLAFDEKRLANYSTISRLKASRYSKSLLAFPPLLG
jgi:hypothetical protein